MARTFLCIQCGIEFPSALIYDAHKKSGHISLREKGVSLVEPTPNLPPGFSQDAAPTPEFMEMVNRIESDKEKPAEPQSAPSQHPSEIPAAAPIKLEYIWRGQCPTDHTEVATFELDVAGQHFCLAVCPTCKKQLDTKEVATL